MKTYIKEKENIPEDIMECLGGYGDCVYDGWCGEVIGQGYPVRRHLGETLWAKASQYGDLECLGMGNWFLVREKLTLEEAITKYGNVTEMEVGPRGGYKSITIGDKKFITRQMRPENNFVLPNTVKVTVV